MRGSKGVEVQKDQKWWEGVHWVVGPLEPSKLSNSLTYFSRQTEMSFTALHWKIVLMCGCENAGILDTISIDLKEKNISLLYYKDTTFTRS